MVHCHSAAALKQRRRRAVYRGYVRVPPRHFSFVLAAKAIAPHVKRMAASVAIHAEHNRMLSERGEASCHFARSAALRAASAGVISAEEAYWCLATHREANRAKHDWRGAWADAADSSSDADVLQPAGVAAERHYIGDGDQTDREKTEDDAYWTTECNAGECWEGQAELQAAGSGQSGSADLQRLGDEGIERIGADAEFEDLVYQGSEEISSAAGGLAEQSEAMCEELRVDLGTVLEELTVRRTEARYAADGLAEGWEVKGHAEKLRFEVSAYKGSEVDLGTELEALTVRRTEARSAADLLAEGCEVNGHAEPLRFEVSAYKSSEESAAAGVADQHGGLESLAYEATEELRDGTELEELTAIRTEAR